MNIVTYLQWTWPDDFLTSAGIKTDYWNFAEINRKELLLGKAMFTYLRSVIIVQIHKKTSQPLVLMLWIPQEYPHTQLTSVFFVKPMIYQLIQVTALKLVVRSILRWHELLLEKTPLSMLTCQIFFILLINGRNSHNGAVITILTGRVVVGEGKY